MLFTFHRWRYVCVCVCVCIYMYTYIHIYTRTYTHTYTNIHTYIHNRGARHPQCQQWREQVLWNWHCSRCVCVRVYIYIYTRTYIYIHIHAHIYTDRYTYIPEAHDILNASSGENKFCGASAATVDYVLVRFQRTQQPPRDSVCMCVCVCV